jgi:TPR repeat protein
MYDYGEGVLQDYVEAGKWYRLAAEQGHALAQGNLGALYGNGQGVPQEYVQAHMWFSLAASSLPPGEDHVRAVQYRDLVAKRMTPAQIAEAQKLAREWKPREEKSETPE